MVMQRAAIRKMGRGFIDNELVDHGYLSELPANAITLYVLLVRRANHKTQSCYTSIDRIRKDTGVNNRNSVIKAILILESHGLIQVTRKAGKCHVFLLLSHTTWIKPTRITIDTILRSNAPVSQVIRHQYQIPTNSSIASDTQSELKKITNLNMGTSENTSMIVEVLSVRYGRTRVLEAVDILAKESGKIPNFKEVVTYLDVHSS